MSYQLSKEESNRIDILKTVSIIFVVYIHAYAVEVGFAGEVNALGLPIWLRNFEDFVSQVIASFAVPMYFLISSVLLFKSERKYIPTLKKKVKTLLIPYLFWNTMGVLIFIILQMFPFTAPFFSGASTPVLKSSFTEWLSMYGVGLECPKVYPLWFLRDLMVITAIFPIIKMIVEKLQTAALIIGLLLVMIPGIISFQSAFTWIFIGACVVKLDLRMEQLDKIPVSLSILSYVVISIIVLFTEIEILDSIYLIIGVLFWIRMSKEIYNHSLMHSFMKKLFPCTFIIYAFHEPAMTALKKLCLKLLPTTPGLLTIEYLVIPIVMIGCCALLGFSFKKIMPKLYGIATGER